MKEKFILWLTFNPGVLLTGSVPNNPFPVYCKLTSWFEPAIQLKSWFLDVMSMRSKPDICQLTITWMSNYIIINYHVCCWTYALMIHTASHVDYENRVMEFYFYACMRLCSYSYGAPLYESFTLLKNMFIYHLRNSRKKNLIDVIWDKNSVKPSVTVKRGRRTILLIRSRKTEPRNELTGKQFGNRLQETELSERLGDKMSCRRGSVLRLWQQHLQVP